MKHKLASLLLITLVQTALPMALGSSSASAQEFPATLDQNVFVFGGRFQAGFVQDTFAFWDADYENNFFAGLGYQNFLYHYGLVRAGVEVGAGVRVGESQPSGEVWAGIVARYDGFQVGGFRISPAITAGLSLASGPVGIEAKRSADLGQTFPLLYYMGPEVSVSHISNPNVELIARVQHRSGGFGTIGKIDASNAATVGLRFSF